MDWIQGYGYTHRQPYCNNAEHCDPPSLPYPPYPLSPPLSPALPHFIISSKGISPPPFPLLDPIHYTPLKW